MDNKYWEAFEKSGSIKDYLAYKKAEEAADADDEN